MKNQALINALLAGTLCLLQAGVGAQPQQGNRDGNGNGYGNSNRGGNGGRGACGPGDQGCERERSRDMGRNGNGNRQGREGPARFEGDRGAGPGHSYYRGDHLPMEYRSRRFVVDDYRGHGLRAPPRGYHWVQTGGDYVLVAIATGVILELLLSR